MCVLESILHTCRKGRRGRHGGRSSTAYACVGEDSKCSDTGFDDGLYAVNIHAAVTSFDISMKCQSKLIAYVNAQ